MRAPGSLGLPVRAPPTPRRNGECTHDRWIWDASDRPGHRAALTYDYCPTGETWAARLTAGRLTWTLTTDVPGAA
jgi:hypothetical protein